MGTRSLSTVLALSLPLFACQGSSFSGGTPSSPAPAANPDQPPSKDPSCQDATQINSKSTTQSFTNGAPGNSFTYQLILTGCDGKIRPITAGSLLFDIDALREKDLIEEGFRFKLTIGKEVIKGQLEAVRGKDLFGNEGSSLYYYQNRSDIAFSGDSKEGTLEIDLNGERIFPRLTPNAKEPFPIDTYLKFGPAKPISHQVIAERPPS